MMDFPRLGGIAYGGDYNPEQWPEEVWREDVRLMREAGVNLVSVGIFSWARLELRPGEYDFAWLDRVLGLLHENGVMACLATATASPPPWLAKLHPESLPVTKDGVTLHPGARQHYSPSSRAYREYASRLARKIAERYKDHPVLAAWHVNNEYACHVPECYSDESAEAFRAWLEERYGTLDALNEAWGTDFWSQRYSEWDEILPPRSAPTFPNPTQQLDFKRFSSDALLALFEMEKEILREATPNVPITTNFLGFSKDLDLWKWTAREDFVSVDMYPDPSDPDAHVHAAMVHDLMRSVGGGEPFVLMEQTTVRVNWRERNVPKRPGEMRLSSLGTVARGADGIMFFQWRASKAGAEKFHSAMVPHVRPEDSRSWREVKSLGADLETLEELRGSRVESEVAVLLDWESWWALELDSKPSTAARQLEGVFAFYKSLFEANVSVDFAHPASDLSKYRVVIAPHLYLVTDSSAENINRFVREGGSLVMSFFSGIVDENEHVRLGGYPAPFRETLGVLVEDFAPMAEGERNVIVADHGSEFECDMWADVMRSEEAESIAAYKHGFLAGTPAVTKNSFGNGAAYYLGTRPEEGFMVEFVKKVCDEAGIEAVLETPPGVAAARRISESSSFLFVMNHGAEAAKVFFGEGGFDMLSGKEVPGVLVLEPFEAAVIREERT